MRKIYILLFLSLPFFIFSQKNVKLDIILRNKLPELTKNSPDQFQSLLVKGNPEQIRSTVLKYQGIFKRSAGDICSVEIPYKNLASFSNDIAVERIENTFAKGALFMDTARIRNNIDSAHNGISPLIQPYKGKNVVVGVIDGSLYFRHKDFRDSAGGSRILYLWDQVITTGVAPSPYGYGSSWTKAQIDAGTCGHIPPTSDQGHGTNVTGIACGNGLSHIGNPSLDKRYLGAAPKSDIIFVRIDYNSNDFFGKVIDAVDFIFSKATALGKPCVINTSVGTYFGSHDGNDLATAYIENLLTAQNGRSLVAAGGNAGTIKMHLSYNLSATDSQFTWFQYNSSLGGVYYDLWADTAQWKQANFAIGCDTNIPAFLGRTKYYNISNFNPTDGNCVTILDTIKNSLGRDLGYATIDGCLYGSTYNIHFFIVPKKTNYLWRLQTKGAGRFDLWASSAAIGNSNMPTTLPGGFSSPNYRFGDTLKTLVSSWQNSDKVITVANYNSRASYVDMNGITQSGLSAGDILGSRAKSSSFGPTRDGRIKPDIAATGSTTLATGDSTIIALLISTSQQNKVGQGGKHSTNGGTSMASPEVAGTVALLFEKNPNASYADVKSAIIRTASQDNFTNYAIPNIEYGYGKLNAYQALLDMRHYVWNGSVSSDWSTPQNWTPNGIPNSCEDSVKIPAATSFSPIISASDIQIGSVDISSTVNLQLAGKNISLCKNWKGGATSEAIVSGTGKVIMQSSNPQLISGFTKFNYLETDNSAGNKLNGTAYIQQQYSPKTGNFDVTNGTMKFLSVSANQCATINFTTGNNGRIIGNIQSERWVPITGYNQHFISSPIKNLPLTQWNASGTAGYVLNPTCDETQAGVGSPYGSLFRYHEDHGASCSLLGWEVIPSGNAENQRGYSLYLNGNAAYTLSGEANQDSAYSLSDMTNSGWATNTSLQGRPMSNGWNLVGNPYLSTINLSSKTGFDAQVQVWQTSGPYSGTYQTLFMSSNALIPPHQAFMVRKSLSGTSTFSIPKSDCANPTSQPTFYKNLNDQILLIRAIGNGFQDKSILAFNLDATDSFDTDFDAHKFHSRLGQPTIYTLNHSTHLGYNILNNISSTMLVPLSFEPGADGNFTLHFDSLSSFNVNQKVFLEDKKLGGNWIDLKQTPDYSFVSQKTDDWNRFNIHFKVLESNSINDLKGNTVQIYSSEQTIFIQSEENIKQVTVYNLLGQILYKQSDLGLKSSTISLDHSEEIVIVDVLTQNSENRRKLFLSK